MSLYVPEYILADAADRSAQGGNSIEAVKLIHRPEVLAIHVVIRGKPASVHQGVGNAGLCRITEDQPDVKVIVFFQ